MEKIKQLEKEMMRIDLPDFAAGDTVKVHVKIKEGEKERIQVFQGVVISKRRGTTNASFTVRKVSYGIGVERIFPMHSPIIDQVEVVTKGRVRRATPPEATRTARPRTRSRSHRRPPGTRPSAPGRRRGCVGPRAGRALASVPRFRSAEPARRCPR